MYGTYTYFERHSTTSAAHCRICGGKIAKGEARIGYNYQYYRWNGIKWDHLRCVGLKGLYKRSLQEMKQTTSMLLCALKIEIKNSFRITKEITDVKERTY